MSIHATFAVCCVSGLCVLAAAGAADAATLHVGAATRSITPDKPIALAGQMHTRIAREVESEVQANALAIESRNGEEVLEQAIFVACGVVHFTNEARAKAQEILRDRIPDFDAAKLIISATHTHTSGNMREGRDKLPDEGVMRPAEFEEFFANRVADAAEAAWKARKPAKAGWGMADALVGYNRRSYFADGHGQMYGNLAVDGFRGIEGPEDHAIEILFFWDESDRLMATAVNVVCPAQEVESLSVVNADFWHPVREGLKAKYGEHLVVLGWIGAAGDQSPHIRYRKAAEDRMRRLRGLTRLEEIARRLIRAWEETYEVAQLEKFEDVPMTHVIKSIELPKRMVTVEEYEDAKKQAAALADDPKRLRRMMWFRKAVDRYESQQAGEVEPYEMELHVIRLGDVAIATNDFELYTQYGIQMKAKSKALHTFIIQLAGEGSYVPTPFAVEGGGYSAVIQSNTVGPEGGQVLVDETVATVNSLWGEK